MSLSSVQHMGLGPMPASSITLTPLKGPEADGVPKFRGGLMAIGHAIEMKLDDRDPEVCWLRGSDRKFSLRVDP